MPRYSFLLQLVSINPNIVDVCRVISSNLQSVDFLISTPCGISYGQFITILSPTVTLPLKASVPFPLMRTVFADSFSTVAPYRVHTFGISSPVSPSNTSILFDVLGS